MLIRLANILGKAGITHAGANINKGVCITCRDSFGSDIDQLLGPGDGEKGDNVHAMYDAGNAGCFGGDTAYYPRLALVRMNNMRS